MGKTRYLFKKIGDIEGIFHERMGMIKVRKGKDVTEVEDVEKKQQEYTEETIQKSLNDPDNHDGVVTHLEPDILECEVKRTVGSFTRNKANESDGIPAELFQILKDDALKVLHSIWQQIWKTQQWPQDRKRSVSFFSSYIYFIEVELTYNISGAQQGDSAVHVHIYYF